MFGVKPSRGLGAATSAPAWLFHRPPNLDGSIIPALSANFPLLTDPRMLGDLERLKQNSGGTLALADMPEPAGEPYRPEDAAPLKLDCREFKGRIARDWLICSFSYFKAGKQEELPDRDNVPPAKREEIPGTGIFAFPKGAKAGTCLHEILQKLDFGATDRGHGDAGQGKAASARPGPARQFRGGVRSPPDNSAASRSIRNARTST